MKLNQLIKELDLEPGDKIFIRHYKKDEETECTIASLKENNKILNNHVKYLQHHYGGKRNNYNCYRIILE